MADKYIGLGQTDAESIQSISVNSAAPANADVLSYNSARNEYTHSSGGGGASINDAATTSETEVWSANRVLNETISHNNQTAAHGVSNVAALSDATAFQGVAVNASAPAATNILSYNSVDDEWAPGAAAGGGTDLTGTQVDNAITRGNGTDTVQSSDILIDDTDNMTGVTSLEINDGVNQNYKISNDIWTADHLLIQSKVAATDAVIELRTADNDGTDDFWLAFQGGAGRRTMVGYGAESSSSDFAINYVQSSGFRIAAGTDLKFALSSVAQVRNVNDFRPGSDYLIDLGATNRRWIDGYFGGLIRFGAANAGTTVGNGLIKQLDDAVGAGDLLTITGANAFATSGLAGGDIALTPGAGDGAGANGNVNITQGNLEVAGTQVLTTQQTAVADVATTTTVGANTGTAGAGLSLIGDTSSVDQSSALMNDLLALQEDILDFKNTIK